MDSETAPFVTVMQSVSGEHFPVVRHVGSSGDYEIAYLGNMVKWDRAHAEAEGRAMAVRLKMEFRP